MLADSLHTVRTWRQIAITTLVAGGLALASSPAIADETVTPGEWQSLKDMGFPKPTESQAKEQITVYGDGAPVAYGDEDSIEALDTTDEEDGEQVISLSSDILFALDKWDLPDSAQDKIEELVEDVPDDETLSIYGHTDSVQGEVDNDELSTKRAEAVADVVSDARSDLELDVEGFADSKPAEQESGSDEEAARKANRRVELRYE